jgi:hypothetical protein
MVQLIEYYEAHHETHEVPFGRIYHWYPSYVVVDCECGEKLAFDDSDTATTCPCGANHVEVIGKLQELGQLRERFAHPWLCDTQRHGEQHRLEEAAYHRGSPWRYNDILRRVIRAMNKTSAARRDSTRKRESASMDTLLCHRPRRFWSRPAGRVVDRAFEELVDGGIAVAQLRKGRRQPW